MWACERAGVVPDMLTSAKGLGNGFPVGATLCRDWIAEDYGSHASTFSGGPVISAAAEATVSTLVEAEVPAHAEEMGAYLRAQLAERLGDSIREIRGRGLMVGIEVRRGSNRVLRDLALEHGVLALPAGRTVVRLLPPLTIDRDQADEVVDALEAVVD
jgi:acetylornithine aminotransferase apoenzyme (EC 2.6.1.11)/N2-acetyl-L-lysine aminotransferase apoenzyme (EC 2.6.1.-)